MKIFLFSLTFLRTYFSIINTQNGGYFVTLQISLKSTFRTLQRGIYLCAHSSSLPGKCQFGSLYFALSNYLIWLFVHSICSQAVQQLRYRCNEYKREDQIQIQSFQHSCQLCITFSSSFSVTFLFDSNNFPTSHHHISLGSTATSISNVVSFFHFLFQ